MAMVNTDGSVVGTHAACGGLSQDHLGTFLGAFACNLGIDSVFFPGDSRVYTRFGVCCPKRVESYLVGE